MIPLVVASTFAERNSLASGPRDSPPAGYPISFRDRDRPVLTVSHLYAKIRPPSQLQDQIRRLLASVPSALLRTLQEVSSSKFRQPVRRRRDGSALVLQI